VFRCRQQRWQPGCVGRRRREVNSAVNRAVPLRNLPWRGAIDAVPE
jgi:hypothetical protein